MREGDIAALTAFVTVAEHRSFRGGTQCKWHALPTSSVRLTTRRQTTISAVFGHCSAPGSSQTAPTFSIGRRRNRPWCKRVITTESCREDGPPHCLWLVCRDRNAGGLCPGETQSAARSRLRQSLHPGVGLWVSARRMAVWHHRSHLGLRGFSTIPVYREVTHDDTR